MSQDDSPPSPARVEITAEYLKANEAKRAAYEKKRREWVREWTRPLRDSNRRGRAGGTVHDKRQGTLDL
jgi:hypothetical protein